MYRKEKEIVCKLCFNKLKRIYEVICDPCSGVVTREDYINHINSKFEMAEIYKTTFLKEKAKKLKKEVDKL